MKINYLTIILGIVVVLLVANTLKGCQDAKELKILNEALDAKLITWKDKEGLNNAKITAFEARDADTFLDLQTKDSLILELQDEVKKAKRQIKKGGSVTILEGETKFDTIFTPSNGKIYTHLFNEYITGNVSNEWIDSDFGFKLDSIDNKTFKIDSTKFNLKVRNKYIVTLGKENGKAFAMVKNLNPYTSTTALRAFETSFPKPPKITIGGFFGPGVLLAKDPKLGLVLGAGINYKF